MDTIADTLQAAVNLRLSRQLDAAEQLCKEVLSRDGESVKAWHLLALVQMDRHDWETALDSMLQAVARDKRDPLLFLHLAEIYRGLGNQLGAETCTLKSLELDPQLAPAHFVHGLVMLKQNKPREALISFERVLVIEPKNAQAHCQIGQAHWALGKLDDAAESFQKAIALDARMATAHHQLGLTRQQQGKLDEAICAYRTALAIEPKFVSAALHLATLLHLQNRLAEAIAQYQLVLSLDPNCADAHCNLGSAHKTQHRYDQAVECYRRALECNPRLAEAHFNLGVIRQQQGNMHAAGECYRHAIDCQPDYAHAWSNLGTVYRQARNLPEATRCFDRALQIKPNFSEALNNLGNLLQIQGREAEAMVCYTQSLKSRPDYIQARYNRALALLAAGDFAAGLAEYDCRLACADFPVRHLEIARWDGSPLAGRTLLVHAEQGLGDTLMFARYVKEIATAGHRVFFEVQRSLVPLLSQSGFANLIPRGDALPPVDLQIPLLSLPGVCGTRVHTIPHEVPYLSADPKLIEAWRDRLLSLPGFRVGIAWQGSTTYNNDYYRSVPLAKFEPFATSGVQLVSLQKGPGEEQLAGLAGRFPVKQLTASLDDGPGAFTDTAAIIRSLDLVITTDSAVAHLAGALAAKIWLLLPISPDWRWLRGRDDSPWYPTMRLFRQTRFDDWSDVFSRAAAAMAAEVGR